MLVILFISVFEYTYFCFKSVFEYLPHSLLWPYFHIYIIWSLHRPGETEVVFCVLRKILPTSSKRLRKSYQGYLGYVIEMRDSNSRLEDIPIVR